MAILRPDSSKPVDPSSPYPINSIVQSTDQQTDPEKASSLNPLISFSFTKVYLVANMPTASGNTSNLIYVADAVPPSSRVLYSDGTNWISY